MTRSGEDEPLGEEEMDKRPALTRSENMLYDTMRTDTCYTFAQVCGTYSIKITCRGRFIDCGACAALAWELMVGKAVHMGEGGRGNMGNPLLTS